MEILINFNLKKKRFKVKFQKAYAQFLAKLLKINFGKVILFLEV